MPDSCDRLSLDVEMNPYPAAGIEVGLIQRFVPLGRRRVLEIGCGDGRLTMQLARLAASVVAIDPDREALGEAQAAAKQQGIRNVQFFYGAAEAVRRVGAPFDVAVFSWSL
jgi:2-polyprenyl-3-methyl-5-hydroxy-6-metoxy-1,4-benzoquinol methylase